MSTKRSLTTEQSALLLRLQSVNDEILRLLAVRHHIERGLLIVKASDETLRDMVVAVVAEAFAVTPWSIMEGGRPRTLAFARQVAMTMTRETLRLSSNQVGTLFNRDHGTVLHAARAVSAAVETNRVECARVASIRAQIKAMLA